MLATAWIPSTTTMNLYQAECGGAVQDPFAVEYANYEDGYDQWQQWEQRQRQQRHFMSSSRRRSLLSEIVDPRVEQHMQLAPEHQPQQVPDSSNPWDTELLRQSPLVSRDEGTGAYPMTQQQQERYKKDASVCSSTKGTCESDEDSCYNIAYPTADPAAWEFPDPQELELTRTVVMQQQAMLQALRMKREQQLSAKQQQQQAVQQPPGHHNAHRHNHGVGKSINILSIDRVKRAMERGDSIRILQCSGCCRELLVTPDLPLVYCPHCECFSHQKTTAARPGRY